MNLLTSNLHKLESDISDILSSQNYSNETLQEIITNTDFDNWLAKEIDTIKNILGDDFFEQRGRIVVKEETISKIENKIVKIAQKHNELEQYKPIVEDIQKLRNKTVYSMFSSYPKLIDQLSTRLNKSVYPLDIIVDKSLKVDMKVKPFVKSLVHVFRNCIDHGIESMDDRAEIGKDEIGTINCSIKFENEKLYIIIADDGFGIDIEKIKQKAVELGIDTKNYDENALTNLIFNDRFSTAKHISQTSGRGIGMAAVKYEIEKLKGEIKIHTKKYKGTTFEFIIPLNLIDKGESK